VFALAHKPTWAFRQHEHPDSEYDGRKSRQPEHPSPVFSSGQEIVSQVRHEDADGDQKLIQGDQCAAAVGGRNLGDIEGTNVGTHTDRQAYQNSSRDQRRDAGRQTRHQAGDEEEHGDGDHHSPAPEMVRQPPAEAGSHSRARQHGAGYLTLQQRREGEVLLQE
jgi:hypothetical protein